MSAPGPGDPREVGDVWQDRRTGRVWLIFARRSGLGVHAISSHDEVLGWDEFPPLEQWTLVYRASGEPRWLVEVDPLRERIRQMDAARGRAADRAQRAVVEAERRRAALDRVRALHQPVCANRCGLADQAACACPPADLVCEECSVTSPCDTARAIGGGS